MKLAIFGATGPTGQILLKKAHAAGHEVTVYVRNPAKLIKAPTGITVIQGELTDGAAIERAVTWKDAVISLLGPKGRSSSGHRLSEPLFGGDNPIADGMKRIVDASKALHVPRLIATATPSFADPNDRFSLPFWLGVHMVKLMARVSYSEIMRIGAVVRDSGLDWTLARLPVLSDAPALKPAFAGYVGDPRIRFFSLSREALADFLLAQLVDRTWICKAPALSNG